MSMWQSHGCFAIEAIVRSNPLVRALETVFVADHRAQMDLPAGSSLHAASARAAYPNNIKTTNEITVTTDNIV